MKLFFYLTLGYFLRTPVNSNLFSISLEGSSYRESTLHEKALRSVFKQGKIRRNESNHHNS